MYVGRNISMHRHVPMEVQGKKENLPRWLSPLYFEVGPTIDPYITNPTLPCQLAGGVLSLPWEAGITGGLPYTPDTCVVSGDLKSGLLASVTSALNTETSSQAPKKFKEHFGPSISVWHLWVVNVLLKEKHKSEPVKNLWLDSQGEYRESCLSCLPRISMEDSECGLDIQLTPGEVSTVQWNRGKSWSPQTPESSGRRHLSNLTCCSYQGYQQGWRSVLLWKFRWVFYCLEELRSEDKWKGKGLSRP